MTRSKPRAIAGLATLASVVIFIVDSLMPLGVAGGVPYVFPVLLGFWLPKQRHIFLLAALCSTLVVVGYFVSPVGALTWVAVTNRFMAMFVIWFAAILVAMRRHAMSKSQESERLLEKHIEHMPMAAITFDTDGRITDWNPMAEKIFGYTFREVKGRDFSEVIVPSDERSAARKRWQALVRKKYRWGGIGKNLTKDGRAIRCDWYSTPLVNDDGQFVGIACLVMDITWRTELEEHVRIERDKAQTYLDTAQVMLVALDSNGLIMLINRKGCELLGYEEAELLGNSWFDMCLPENSRKTVKEVFRRVSNGEIDGIEEYENIILTKDGQERTLRFFNTFIRGEDDSIVGTLSSAHDVTHVNAMQNALVVAKENAERANQAKTNFLASMSHELRTPLNAILGFGELLAADIGQPLKKQQHYIDNITYAAEHLIELINDVLNFAQIEVGEARLSIEDIQVESIFDECFDLSQTAAMGGDITLQKAYYSTTITTVRADRTRTKQILLNLLSNAIKYNRDGGTVTASCYPVAPGMLRFEVVDTGKGIPADKYNEIFKPFSRLGEELSNTQGTGIGLSVCKTLVELMGGTIGFDSTVGHGTTFWFLLPLVNQESRMITDSVPHAERRLSKPWPMIDALVLYIEDNHASIQLMEAIIDMIDGLHLISVRTAEDGIEIAKTRQPDMIVLDVNLPGMSGIEALEHLSQLPETRNIPAICLSAGATQHDIDRGLRAGFRNYLVKPVPVDVLVGVLHDTVRSARL